MGAKVASLIITLILNGLVSTILFFGMILAMNGYSERNSETGIYLYIILVGISVVATAVLSFFLCGYLQNKRNMSSVVAALISIVGFAIINGVISFIAIIISIALAEAKRKGGF